MAIDFDDAMRSGAVSARAAKKHSANKQAALPGVKGPKAKGSMPMGVRKQEGALSAHGAVPLERLNSAAEYQRGGRPSKGGGVKGSNTPGVKHIEHYPNKKAFPAGGTVSGSSSQKNINPRSRGKIPPSGGYYGGGGQNTQ
jgi:hypothetical protein